MQTENTREPSFTSRRDVMRNGLLATAALGLGAAATADAAAQEPSRTGALAGKIALVTGAARGIGRAIAEEYARAGAAVAMLDLADPDAVPPVDGFRIANMQEFDDAVAAVQVHGGRVLKVQGDVRSLAGMEAIAEQIVSELGGLDAVVANAGYVRWHSFADGTELDWKSVYDTNVHGVFNTFRAAIPHLRRRGGGRLIALSSIGGRQGVPGNGAYTSTKWAVIGMVKQAALELGPENITVNAIAPGPVDTPMYRSEGQIRSMGLTTAEEQDRVIGGMLPLGTKSALAPKEIADAAIFLASDAAASISGVSLDVALGYNAVYTS